MADTMEDNIQLFHDIVDTIDYNCMKHNWDPIVMFNTEYYKITNQLYTSIVMSKLDKYVHVNNTLVGAFRLKSNKLIISYIVKDALELINRCEKFVICASKLKRVKYRFSDDYMPIPVYISSNLDSLWKLIWALKNNIKRVNLVSSLYEQSMRACIDNSIAINDSSKNTNFVKFTCDELPKHVSSLLYQQLLQNVKYQIICEHESKLDVLTALQYDNFTLISNNTRSTINKLLN